MAPDAAKNTSQAAPRDTVRRRHGKLIAWIAFSLLGLGVALFLTLAILVHRADGILRHRIINTLSTRFKAHVELPRFSVSVWHGFEANGSGLKIYPDALPQNQPLFAIGSFYFHTAWWNLLRSPMRVGAIRVTDLAINMPPKQRRSNLSFHPPGEKGRKNKIEILVETLDIDHARLVLGTDKPDKEPLVFNIHNLRMHSIGPGRPMRFHATLVNPKPIGDIDSTGAFGPFNADDAGASPVQGNYTFSHADLNSIHGLGGMLSSKGVYNGRLDHIVVDGTTDTPNFSIDVAGLPVPLKTRFHAVVDGTNGNTYLQPVDAYLRNSHIVARGFVERVKGKGHHIFLKVKVGDPGTRDANIGDMLALAMRTRPPVLRGPLELTTTLDLPPGKQHVASRLRLKGQFRIRDATFSNPKFQSKVDELSLRAQGKPNEAERAARRGRKIPSRMRGDFLLDNARLRITNLHYDVPGAAIALNGVYSMDGKLFDFHGKVRLKASLSGMVSTWWKKLLLLPVDPIFAGKKAGTVIPIQITGADGTPHFGLDFFHHDKR